MNKKSDKIRYVKLSKLEDLVRLSTAHGLSFIYHLKVNKGHLYFVYTSNANIISLVVTDRGIEKKYIVYNTFEDKVTFSNEFNPNTKSNYIKVLEVEKQNIIPEELI